MVNFQIPTLFPLSKTHTEWNPERGTDFLLASVTDPSTFVWFQKRIRGRRLPVSGTADVHPATPVCEPFLSQNSDRASPRTCWDRSTRYRGRAGTRVSRLREPRANIFGVAQARPILLLRLNDARDMTRSRTSTTLAMTKWTEKRRLKEKQDRVRPVSRFIVVGNNII